MTPTHTEISAIAHSRWVTNGRRKDTQLRDWLEAEGALNLLSVQSRQLAEYAPPERGQLLQAILDNSNAVVNVKDTHGRYLLVNRRFETLFGLTQEQMAGRSDHEVFPSEIADGLRANDLRVLAAGIPLEFEELIPHDDGIHTYISLEFPIAGPTGLPYALCRISTDITARKQAQCRLRAEHAVTRTLGKALTLGEAMPLILQGIGESIGWEVGIYWGMDRGASVLRCVEIWQAATSESTAFEQTSRWMTFPKGVGLPGRIWEIGEPVWMANAAQDTDCPWQSALMQCGMWGGCGFPIGKQGEFLGVVGFFSRLARTSDDDVLAMMANVSNQMSQFIERRQSEKALYERGRELALARAIQQRRLPSEPPALGGFDIAGVSLPTQETGGDYLDFIPMPGNSLGVAVGDACGHGIAAAIIMAEARAYLRALARTDLDVGRLLTLVSHHLAEDIDADDFVTLFLARLEPHSRSLVYSSAGHWPGYLLDGQGEVKKVLRATGVPLGIDPSGPIHEAVQVELTPGDLLLMLTDGIAEAFCSGGFQFGMARALECVRFHRRGSAREVVTALVNEVQTFTGERQIDDMTVVVLKVIQP